MKLILEFAFFTLSFCSNFITVFLTGTLFLEDKFCLGMNQYVRSSASRIFLKFWVPVNFTKNI